MKIALVKLEKYPNLALEKLRIYHKNRGDIVVDETLPIPPMFDDYDKIYVSSIFTSTDKSVIGIKDVRYSLGGTGFNLNTRLADEIEVIEPHQNFGFASRGCIRKCKFCAVPKKEGAFKVIGDLYTLWDGCSNSVTFYDNSPLADNDHFEKLCKQAIKLGINIDFNQGLDIRLLTEQHVKLMSQIKSFYPRFSFDYLGLKDDVIKKATWLNNNFKKSMVYMLVGFDSTIYEDLERLRILKELKLNAYVMIYKPLQGDNLISDKMMKIYRAIASWANQIWTFHKYTLSEFLLASPDKSYYIKYFLELGIDYIFYDGETSTKQIRENRGVLASRNDTKGQIVI